MHPQVLQFSLISFMLFSWENFEIFSWAIFTWRYKIYVEGWGWSVSEKYVLACDSMTLLIKPYHHDFFTRSMVPLQHYWLIRPRNKCRDLKFAVEWGNTHPEKVTREILGYVCFERHKKKLEKEVKWIKIICWC